MHRGVAEKPERALRCDRGIELPQRTRRRIARIGEHRLTGGDAFLVHLRESTEREVRLAANFDQRRWCLGLQAQRHVVHRAQIRCDVLTDRAAATCGASHEHTVAIGERYRRTINLQFAAVAVGIHRVAREFAEPFFPRLQFRFIERVVERQHWDEMRVLRQRRLWLAAHAQRWRVRSAQLGMFTLDLLQLAEELVIHHITQRRLIQHVIFVAGSSQLLAQFCGAVCQRGRTGRGCRRHGRTVG